MARHAAGRSRGERQAPAPRRARGVPSGDQRLVPGRAVPARESGKRRPSAASLRHGAKNAAAWSARGRPSPRRPAISRSSKRPSRSLVTQGRPWSRGAAGWTRKPSLNTGRTTVRTDLSQLGQVVGGGGDGREPAPVSRIFRLAANQALRPRSPLGTRNALAISRWSAPRRKRRVKRQPALEPRAP